MERSRKSLSLEVKSYSEDGPGTLTGYGSVKNVLDSYDDVIVDGAYQGLDELVKSGYGAVGHDWYETPIAMIMDAREDEYGLLFTWKFHSTDEAQAARRVIMERIAEGKTVPLSIGYYVTDSSYERREGKDVRILRGIQVFEISYVNTAANSAAMATDAKADRTGVPFAKQLDHCLGQLDEIITRADEIAELRSGVSETKRVQLGLLKSRIDSILGGESTPEEEAKGDGLAVPLGAIHELQQRARLLGLN